MALPNYGSRVSWNRAGWVTAIESKVERCGVDEESEELFAKPEEVARFLEQLRRDHPANLKGIVCFRLPTVRDRRAWSLSTPASTRLSCLEVRGEFWHAE